MRRCRGAPSAPVCRPAADRVDGDRGPANERDRAGTMLDHDEAMLVVGDEPNHDLEGRQDAPGKGFEGDA